MDDIQNVFLIDYKIINKDLTVIQVIMGNVVKECSVLNGQILSNYYDMINLGK